MVDPYRSPASIDTCSDGCPVGAYSGPGQCAGCEGFVPEPLHFAAQISATPSPSAPTHRSLRLSTLLSMAALVFMGSASAAMVSLAYSIATANRVHAAPPAGAPAKEKSPKHGPKHRKARPPRPARHDVLRPSLPSYPPSHPRAEEPLTPSDAPTMPSLLNTLGPITHSPIELWQRAETLERAGSEITLTSSRIAEERLTLGDLHTRILPVKGGFGGIKFLRLSPNSEFGQMGIQSGDIVTAINGYSMLKPETGLEAYGSIHQERMAVIEILRNGQWIMLKVAVSRPARSSRNLLPLK